MSARHSVRCSVSDQTSYRMTLKTKTTHITYRHSPMLLEQVESAQRHVACWEWILETQKRSRNIWIRVGMQACVVGMAKMDSDELVAAIKIIYEATDGSCWLLDFAVEMDKMWHFHHVWMPPMDATSTSSNENSECAAVCYCFLSPYPSRLRSHLFTLWIETENWRVYNNNITGKTPSRVFHFFFAPQEHTHFDSPCVKSRTMVMAMATRWHTKCTFFIRYNCLCGTSHILLSDLHSDVLRCPTLSFATNWIVNLV